MITAFWDRHSALKIERHFVSACGSEKRHHVFLANTDRCSDPSAGQLILFEELINGVPAYSHQFGGLMYRQHVGIVFELCRCGMSFLQHFNWHHINIRSFVVCHGFLSVLYTLHLLFLFVLNLVVIQCIYRFIHPESPY